MFKNNLLRLQLQNFVKIRYFSENQKLRPISHILKSKNKTGDVITIKGWIKSLRDQKERVFFDLSDGSSAEKLQVCVSKNSKPPGLSTGASVIASGPLTLSPKGQLELVAQSVEICGTCTVSDGYPFAPRKQYPPEYIRQYLHLRPRTNKFSALLRVRNAATLVIHKHFNLEGFVNIHTPILTSNDCEGAGEVFKVVPDSEKLLKLMEKDGGYFDKKAFLTVSGQLHLEAAAHGLSKVYTFGPTFRAENSRSRLHLSEFYMVEAEVAFVEDLNEIMRVIEGLVKEVTKVIVDEHGGDVEVCQDSKRSFSWLDKKFPVLTYKEAVDVLVNKGGFKENFASKEGLSKEHELFLVKHCGDIPVFVIEWPKEMKSFYMKESGGGNVAALDLLAPNVGEIVGGSLRENDYDKLKMKIPKTNNHLDWYLELRKFGSVPTGGFGLGFERYLQFVLGINNIKDTIPFPRWPHNCNL